MLHIYCACLLDLHHGIYLSNSGSMLVVGFVLSAMAKYHVTSADVGYRGTQLKMTLVLDGQQQVIFKPRWYNRFCFQYPL